MLSLYRSCLIKFRDQPDVYLFDRLIPQEIHEAFKAVVYEPFLERRRHQNRYFYVLQELLNRTTFIFKNLNCLQEFDDPVICIIKAKMALFPNESGWTLSTNYHVSEHKRWIPQSLRNPTICGTICGRVSAGIQKHIYKDL